jgi:exonuclease III
VKLITWNVAGRVAKLDRQVGALDRAEPDLVCLQEIRASTVPRWRAALEDMGLAHFADSSAFIGPRRYFVVTASRWELTELPAIPGPYPERVLSLVIETPRGQLELHNTHVPPAPTHGLIKVETLEAIYERLARPCGRHRVLCGDFNIPRLETTDGEVITFAERHPEQIERWDAAERSVITGLAEWDLVDAFRQLHGYERRDVSWVLHTRARRKAGLRLDHVLASRSLNPIHCDYHHEWREAELSDHSAMEAVFEPEDLS